ncbi:D-amino-acid transaminase [bacterium LRH843]|nr:D-amino-acid transaminase [bacterium LRH843]
MSNVLFNDNFFSKVDVKIDIEDRSYQFGDGIYEVIGVYNGVSFKMTEHLQRLERSAKEIRLPLRKSVEDLEAKLEKLISLNNVQNGIIYMQVSRGIAPRTHHFPEPTVDSVVVAYTREMERPVTVQEKGVHCLLTEDIRWLRCDIKSLNLLGSVLAKQKAVESNCYEAILCRDNIITEGSSANLFMVKDKVLFTHPANNYILNGITRSTVIELCQREGMNVVEERFEKKQLLQADEAFLTGTFIDIVPINKIDNDVIGLGEPGPVTKGLQRKFNDLIFKNNEVKEGI